MGTQRYQHAWKQGAPCGVWTDVLDDGTSKETSFPTCTGEEPMDPLVGYLVQRYYTRSQTTIMASDQVGSKTRSEISGTYSGGMAARGDLTPEQVQHIWTKMRELRADTESHVEHRMMGTGSFRVAEADFIVQSGPGVAAFTELVAPLRD